MRFILEEYIDMKPREYIAAALWVLHTHLFDRFTISPRLAFTSPVVEAAARRRRWPSLSNSLIARSAWTV